MKKALILYASMSGNTEKIAHAFEEVFRLYGFQVDLYKAEGKKLSEKQVYFEDYDFICIGSGLIGGQPMPASSLRSMAQMRGFSTGRAPDGSTPTGARIERDWHS